MCPPLCRLNSAWMASWGARTKSSALSNWRWVGLPDSCVFTTKTDRFTTPSAGKPFFDSPKSL